MFYLSLLHWTFHADNFQERYVCDHWRHNSPSSLIIVFKNQLQKVSFNRQNRNLVKEKKICFKIVNFEKKKWYFAFVRHFYEVFKPLWVSQLSCVYIIHVLSDLYSTHSKARGIYWGCLMCSIKPSHFYHCDVLLLQQSIVQEPLQPQNVKVDKENFIHPHLQKD